MMPAGTGWSLCVCTPCTQFRKGISARSYKKIFFLGAPRLRRSAVQGAAAPRTTPRLAVSKIGWFETRLLCNAREHPRADLVAVMERKDKIRPSRTLQRPVG